jgi:four helix bundle protein
VVSVASNIAEGAARSSELDFARYLEMALGSCFEVETQLVLSREIGYLPPEKYESLVSELTILQKQINQFIGKLRK